MRFSTQPSKEVISYGKGKTLLPTTLSSVSLARVDADIRERALFSAKVTNARFLQAIKKSVSQILGEGKSFQEAKSEIQKVAKSIGYDPANPGSIEDIGSDARINLIISTQVAMAQGYGHWMQHQSDVARRMWPAFEFYRAEDRKEPRNWPERWAEQGGQFFDGASDYAEGRMVALKNDPIWENISAFGNPYPPFDYNSGMGIRPIDRKEAEALGLIGAGETVESSDRGFNASGKVRADISSLDDDFMNELEESVGDDFRVEDGVLTNREVVRIMNDLFHVKTYRQLLSNKGNRAGVVKSWQKRKRKWGKDQWAKVKLVGGRMVAESEDKKTGEKKPLVDKYGNPTKRLVGATAVIAATGTPVSELPHLAKFSKDKKTGDWKPYHFPTHGSDHYVNLNPEAKNWIKYVGGDNVGKICQNPEAITHAASEKFDRVWAIESKSDKHEKIAWDHVKSTDVAKQKAALAWLITKYTGIRAGSKTPEEQLAGFKESEKGKRLVTYGICTLKPEHVVYDKKSVIHNKDGTVDYKPDAPMSLEFVGKKQADNKFPIKDADLKNAIITYLHPPHSSGTLLGVSYSDFSAYNENATGAKIHDMRTLKACKLAKDTIAKLTKKHGMPKNETQFKKLRNEVGDVVCAAIENTRGPSLKSYIDPRLFDGWRESAGVQNI